MAKKNIVDRVSDAYNVDDVEHVESGISKNMLTRVVRVATERSTANVERWHCDLLKKGMGGGHLLRISGTASDVGGVFDWSLVLKVLRKKTATAGIADEYDWQREALAYRSGLLDNLPCGLEAAHCYEIEDKSDEEIWMWLEDLSGIPDGVWSLERYALAARHLAKLNGYYLDKSLPDHPWLVRSFEQQAMKRDGNIEAYVLLRDHPIVRKLIPREDETILYELWARRDEILSKLHTRQPQTFGHLDGFRLNLFSRPGTIEDKEPTTVAIDWALCGIGPLGADLKVLVIHSVGFFAVNVCHASELDRLSFEGYIEGLRDTGWDGEIRQIRYSYTMMIAMTIARLFPLLCSLHVDEAKHDVLVQLTGRTVDENIEMNSQLWPFMLGLASEGLALDKQIY